MSAMVSAILYAVVLAAICHSLVKCEQHWNDKRVLLLYFMRSRTADFASQILASGRDTGPGNPARVVGEPPYSFGGLCQAHGRR